MSETYAGIIVPEGDPGALRDSARRLGEAGSQLRDTAGELQGMPTMLGSWQGPASATYAGTCLSQSEAVSRAADGWILAAGVLGVFATELEDAREDARAAIREAEDTTARMKKAQTEIDRARDRLGEADLRAGAAALELSVGALAGAPNPGAHDALSRARDDGAAAERELGRWRREYDDAKDELERAQRRGEQAEQAATDAAQSAKAVFTGIETGMPQLVLPPPPPSKPAPKQDKPWYEDAADWGKGAVNWTVDRGEGLGRGAVEGFQGLGEGGLMLYRLSAINAAIDPAGHRREYEKLGEAGKFAWDNPGEFGKALINYEDLAAGRYDEWLGNLAPDALAALATGGAAPAVSRSLKGADAAGDLARNADRLSEGGRAMDRATDAQATLPDTQAFRRKTTASNGDPTLSGWAQPRPDGFGAATPEDVRKLADDIEHQLKPHTHDQLSRDGFDGKYHASHAEKQQALTSPGSDIAVNRPMCPDCVEFHKKLAQHTGQSQLVTDPNGPKLFLPDGSVIDVTDPSSFPPRPDSSFDGKAAAAGGAGSEGLSATQRDGGR